VRGATYMLLLYRRVIFGPQVNADAAAMPDLTGREIAIFSPLVILTLLLGIYPGLVFNRTAASVENLRAQITSVRASVPQTEETVIWQDNDENEQDSPESEAE